MVRLLVLAVIFILVVIAFRLGRQSEHGRLIDLEPDEAESDKWAAKTAARDAADEPIEAKAYASDDADSVSAGRKGADTAGRKAGGADGDVIDVSPDDIEEL